MKARKGTDDLCLCKQNHGQAVVADSQDSCKVTEESDGSTNWPKCVVSWMNGLCE